MTTNKTEISKFLSYVLRHKPKAINLELDSNGWANIDELVKKSDLGLSHATIRKVVAENKKQRFSISDDGQKIRANQGHSISVDLNLVPKTPPNKLYHGTVQKFIESIRSSGLHPKQRQHVHLSSDIETAKQVGARRGSPLILTIAAYEMNQTGHDFFLSENGVWLTKKVPSKFIL